MPRGRGMPPRQENGLSYLDCSVFEPRFGNFSHPQNCRCVVYPYANLLAGLALLLFSLRPIGRGGRKVTGTLVGRSFEANFQGGRTN